MSQGCAFYPSYIISGLDTGTPEKVFHVQVLSYDIGPTSGPVSGGVTSISKPSDVNVDVVPLFGSIGVYNGITGDNPRGFNVTITITFTGLSGRSSGDVVIAFCPIENYGAPVIIINLDGSIGAISDYILDTFHDVNGVPLNNHTPDTFPLSPGTAGWHGSGSVSSEIQSNKLLIGGNSGIYKFARLYAGLSSCMIYTDVYRSDDPGGGGEAMILLGRCNDIPGAIDTGLDYVAFNAARDNDTHVLLSLSQVVGGIVVHNDSNFMSYAWARNLRKRLFMRLMGDQALCYIGDEGGLSNITLVHSATLATPADDSSHRFTGIAFTHTNQQQNFSAFGTTLVNLLIDAINGLEFDNTIIPIPDQDVDIISEPANFPIGNLVASINYVVGSGWLSAVLDVTTTPAVLTVSIDPTGLTYGVYTANIQIDSDADNSPVLIPVTYTHGLFTDESDPEETPTYTSHGCEV